jgi:sodium transport system ATP-binding protein
VIEVRGLGRDLGHGKDKKRVLDGLTFTAPAGAVTGFLGPNGAGKTTTMRVLSTLLKPNDGTATIHGHDVATDADGVRAVIGLVTEEPGLLNRLTPRELLRFHARCHDMDDSVAERRLVELAGAMGCDDLLDTRSGKLSKGSRAKVALLRALLHDPPVLLLDEPTANLDVVATDAIHELLRRPEVIADKTVLLSTHSVDEAERLCDRVVGIVAGKAVVEGTKQEVIEAVGAPDFRSAFVTLLGHATLAASALEGSDG